MFNNVLVPLDGSELAECALPHAVAISRAFGSHLTLLRVVDDVQQNFVAAFVDPVGWQIGKYEAQAYLDTVGARLAGAMDDLETILLEGSAAERIIEYSLTRNTDLVILSSHGRGGLGSWNISSMAQKILLRRTGSTMIVRAKGSPVTEIGNLHYAKVLVPLDGSLRAEHVLPAATTLGQYYGAQLLAAHVVSAPEMARRTPLNDEDRALANRVIERNTEEANRYFENLRARLPVIMETRVLQSESPSATLQELAENEGVDLVLLSAHGYTGRTTWPYGSVVTDFISYGTKPGLIVQDAPLDVATPGQEPSTRRPEGRPDAQL